jgi:nitroreductase
MDFFDLIQQRRSIRGFSSEPVEEEKLQRILQAVNDAPSAGNRQAFEVYVVRKPADRAALVAATRGQDFLGAAPVMLVFCTHAALSEARFGERGVRLYTMQDASIACTYAMLALVDLGLASVWVGAFDDDAVWKAIGAPPGLAPVAMLPVAYAAQGPNKPKRRRELTDLVHEL